MCREDHFFKVLEYKYFNTHYHLVTKAMQKDVDISRGKSVKYQIEIFCLYNNSYMRTFISLSKLRRAMAS